MGRSYVASTSALSASVISSAAPCSGIPRSTLLPVGQKHRNYTIKLQDLGVETSAY